MNPSKLWFMKEWDGFFSSSMGQGRIDRFLPSSMVHERIGWNSSKLISS
jgi:hypothetical protein